MELSFKPKLFNYLVLGIVIYLSFKYIPKQQLNTRDILVITVVAILSYSLLENLLFPPIVTSPPSQLTCNNQCNKQNLEQMTSLSNTVNEITKTVSDNNTLSSVSLPSNLLSHAPSTQTVSVARPPVSDTTTLPQCVRQPDERPQTMNNGMFKNPDGSYTIKPQPPKRAEAIGSREENDVMGDESAYNYTDYNSLPTYLTNSADDGYSYLPPRYWFPVPPHPPVCVSEKKCPVCPVYTNGTNLDLKEWDQSRRITPPDIINVDAVKEKLNSGR